MKGARSSVRAHKHRCGEEPHARYRCQTEKLPQLCRMRFCALRGRKRAAGRQRSGQDEPARGRVSVLHGPFAPHAAGSGADRLGRGFCLRAAARRAPRRWPRCGDHNAGAGQAQNKDCRTRGRALGRADGACGGRAVFAGGSAHREGWPRRTPPHGGHHAGADPPRLLLRAPAL